MDYKIESYFGEGIAKPIRFFKCVGQLCLRLLNPYYPSSTLEGRIPFEEIEPMAHDLFDRRPYTPPTRFGPDGRQVVFNLEEYKQYLEETDGL